MLAACLDPDSARLFRAFASWRVVARLRRRFDQAKGTVLAVDNAQQTLCETARFLTWLHQQGRRLPDCRQTDIDGWVTSGASTRRWIRDFLVWAAERRLTTVQPPLIPPRGAPVTANDTARWAPVRRLLHDATLDPADRAAGLLVLLYGQPVSRIAQLTVGDLTDTPQGARQGVSLRLGRDSIQLPQPLGELLRGLGDRQHVGVAGRLTGSSGWLFPGRRAGQHLSPAQLQRRLGTLGIAARANRNAALLQLAGEVPIAVLADLLNIHLSTAQRWAEQAGANWARYAASRSGPVG